jgi:hypothetical protein
MNAEELISELQRAVAAGNGRVDVHIVTGNSGHRAIREVRFNDNSSPEEFGGGLPNCISLHA